MTEASDEFRPLGPKEALNDAVKLLLSNRPKHPENDAESDDLEPTKERSHRYFDRWATTSVYDRESAVALCRDLAEYYVLFQPGRSRPSAMIVLRKKLERTGSLAEQLSRELNQFTKFHCNAIHDISEYKETSQYAEILAAYDPLDEEGRLPYYDHELEPGELFTHLDALARLAASINGALGELYGRSKKNKEKQKRLSLGTPPQWWLIGAAWSIFYAHKLPTSGHVGNDLYRFVEAIHLWVAGRPGKFEYYFKAYASIRQEFEELYERYDELKFRGRRYTNSDFLRARPDRRGRVPIRVINEARANEARREELEEILLRGPRHKFPLRRHS